MEAIFYTNSSRLDLRPPLTGKIFVWSPAFLLEPGSTRYSSAPSITNVWFNYQTSYNDFFEVYITETVTLSPMVVSTNSTVGLYQSLNKVICDQSFFVLIGQNRLQLMSVMTIHKKYSHISCWTSVKLIMDDHWQWLSFNAKLACNK